MELGGFHGFVSLDNVVRGRRPVAVTGLSCPEVTGLSNKKGAARGARLCFYLVYLEYQIGGDTPARLRHFYL